MNSLTKFACRTSVLLAKSVPKMMTPTVRFITAYENHPAYKIEPSRNNLHKSNAEELIAKVPVIEVDDDIAVCTGSSRGDDLGHPVQYLRVQNSQHAPVTCLYCGLRYKRKEHHH